MNKNTIIGILFVLIIIVLGFIFFSNDVAAPSTTPTPDSELPDRSGN